ncbi:putative murein peptide carboxypeptidase [Oxobacter pfennigii]|uniref:Putative murein peptide carboxypeptidase n=1 Tax=Oxobacter pfennigii TaxID=36849 RepID=A0A0P8W9F3_9CLOT|nr:LD-carboxypeptidase [Oxobacter pfennigii]KPU45277.1 putative murein peptide carboxypeptidase [Oxobacter pfennigii]
MIKPKVLKKGDTIGLIAPSSAVREEDHVEKSVQSLAEQGFNVVVGESCNQKYGYLSGKDEIRAADINKMFEHPSIRGIFCIRGGYGSLRILDKIDYEAVKQNPKVFLGYSDATALHIAFNNICNLVTFHGPMPASDMISNFDDFTKKSYLKAIASKTPLGKLDNPEGCQIKTLVPGKARGKITGGNLALVASTLGTPYEIDTKDKILFLEDVGEYIYRIDRMLMQLKLAGKFDDCSGIILGDFKDCTAENENSSLTLNEVFQDIIVPLKKPSIYNFMSGHCSPKVTLPFGVESHLDAKKGILKITKCALR